MEKNKGTLKVQEKKLPSVFSILAQRPRYGHIFARAVGVLVGQRSGSQLAKTLVATINIISFFPVFFSRPFLIEGELGSKTLFCEN